MPERKTSTPARRAAQPVVQHEAALAELAQGFSSGEVEVIREQIAAGATDAELAVFLRLSSKYDLDPFAREIWCIVQLDGGQRKLDKNGKPYPAIIAASRDGWLKVAQREPAFDGIISDAVYQYDSFQPTQDGPQHSYGWQEEGEGSAARLVRGRLLGAYAYVYRKDRRVPAYFFAPWAEYGKPNVEVYEDSGKLKNPFSPWARTPSAMIRKVAEHNALKRAFSISGLTSLDDIGRPDPADVPPPGDPPTGEPELPADPPASEAADEGTVMVFDEHGDLVPARDDLEVGRLPASQGPAGGGQASQEAAAAAPTERVGQGAVEEKTGQKPPWAGYRPGQAQIDDVRSPE